MQTVSAPVPLPNVIGSYHHAAGPFRSVRCLAMDEGQTDTIALAATEGLDTIDIADYHILPIVGRRPSMPAWIATLSKT